MNINERVLKEADYILKTKDTIRQLANIFCISKSTVHKDLKERLKHIGHFAITVKKEYWNMGIASMMMEEALEMIKETSLKVLDLEVKEDNLSAINLYKKFNFQEIGRYPQMFNVNQKYYDALLMNLYID